MKNKIPYIHYENIHNRNSAEEIVPYIIELFNPESILDIGCGTGTWLKSAETLGVKKIFGVDGEYINKNQLEISQENFMSYNLQKVLNLNEKYSITLCLEVAEHLDEKYSDNLITSLVNHSDIVIFSAALPYQGGQNHVNEQDFGYWIEKFKKHNYKPLDIVREKFWNNSKVNWWYKQNIFVYTNRREIIEKYESAKPINTYIHPILFQLCAKELERLNNNNSSAYKIFKSLIKKIINI